MKPLDDRTSHAMARVPQKRTTSEEAVALALRSLGHSYRRNVRTLPGTPDFANRSKHWAIQVHGCFWHRHDCRRATTPIHNRSEWLAKFDRNTARDRRVESELIERGFKVVTVWECETKDRSALLDRLRENLG